MVFKWSERVCWPILLYPNPSNPASTSTLLACIQTMLSSGHFAPYLTLCYFGRVKCNIISGVTFLQCMTPTTAIAAKKQSTSHNCGSLIERNCGGLLPILAARVELFWLRPVSSRSLLNWHFPGPVCLFHSVPAAEFISEVSKVIKDALDFFYTGDSYSLMIVTIIMAILKVAAWVFNSLIGATVLRSKPY